MLFNSLQLDRTGGMGAWSELGKSCPITGPMLYATSCRSFCQNLVDNRLNTPAYVTFLRPQWAFLPHRNGKPYLSAPSRKAVVASPSTNRRRRFHVTSSADNYTTVLTVPTGIGASIGGYAGDALPVVRLISTIVDTVITHPNVLNGALMYWPLPNALYVEGFALDQFAAGNYALNHSTNRSNRIGLVLDAAMHPDAILRHKQAAEAARATLGLQVTDYVITDLPLHVKIECSDSGPSWGQISNPESLLAASARLITRGCQAIAVVTKFPEDEDPIQLAKYRAGAAVDAIAGAEAVISHLVTRELHVPCAHAPALPPLNVDSSVSPKAAAEELGYTFLSCVLVGLSKAPKLIPTARFAAHRDFKDIIFAEQVDSIVVPASAFGGSALMNLASAKDALVIAVGENRTAISVSSRCVGIKSERVLYVKSYAEAAGYLAAHKAGIELSALGPFVPRLFEVKN